MRAESVSGLRERLRVELAESEAAARRPGPSPAELETAANEATAAARAATHARDDLAERAAITKERLAALERSLAEREGIPPAARMLADEGAELALSLLDVAPGTERAVAAALGRGASAVVAEDAAAGLTLLQRARDAGLGSLAVLVGKRPAERVAELPVVPLDQLLAATVPSVTDEGFGYDPPAASSGSRARRPRRSCWSSRRGGGSSQPRSRSCRRRRRSRTPRSCRQPRPPSRRRLRTRRSRISEARAPPIRLCCAGSRPVPTGSTRRCWPPLPWRPARAAAACACRRGYGTRG